MSTDNINTTKSAAFTMQNIKDQDGNNNNVDTTADVASKADLSIDNAVSAIILPPVPAANISPSLLEPTTDSEANAAVAAYDFVSMKPAQLTKESFSAKKPAASQKKGFLSRKRHTRWRRRRMTERELICPHESAPPQILPEPVVQNCPALHPPLRPVHVCCLDILRCDVRHLLRITSAFGVNRMCVDVLPHSQVVDIAKRHKTHLAFKVRADCRRNYIYEEIVEMGELPDDEIERLFDRE